METVIYGSLKNDGLEVVRRDNRLFVRYDAGGIAVRWREDEISEKEFARLKASKTGGHDVLLEVERRLSANGADPNASNWSPS